MKFILKQILIMQIIQQMMMQIRINISYKENLNIYHHSCQNRNLESNHAIAFLLFFSTLFWRFLQLVSVGSPVVLLSDTNALLLSEGTHMLYNLLLLAMVLSEFLSQRFKSLIPRSLLGKLTSGKILGAYELDLGVIRFDSCGAYFD